jgi:simple sugar transport system permease protein
MKSALRSLFKREEFGVGLAALVIFAFFLTVAPVIGTPGGLSTVLYGASTMGIMAVGVALLMIGGEFDLSAGVAVVTSSLTAGLVAWYFVLNVWVGVAVALVASLAVGAFNGWLLTRTRLPSFIVTLASFLMLTGLNLSVTRAVGGSVASPSISDMDGFDAGRAVFASTLTMGGFQISVTVFFWLLLVALGAWILRATQWGSWITAVGGDEDAARAQGVPVGRVKIGLYMGVGFCAWLVGMHMLFAFDTVQSGEGIGNEFLYIIAAVIGGTLLTGGYGSVIGAAIGALIFGMVQKGIVFAEWNPDWFKFFLGLMLLVATIINLTVRKRVSRA